MRSKLIMIITAGWLMTLMISCTTHKAQAPRGFLEKPSKLQTHAFGGWIQVSYSQPDIPESGGELIAVGSDTLYLLTQKGLLRVPFNRISAAKLTGYLTNYGSLGLWTFLGTLSSASHGYGAMISLPIWLVIGSASTASFSKMPLLQYPKDPLEDIGAYARFPQGLPEGIDLRRLRPKPASQTTPPQ